MLRPPSKQRRLRLANWRVRECSTLSWLASFGNGPSRLHHPARFRCLDNGFEDAHVLQAVAAGNARRHLAPDHVPEVRDLTLQRVYHRERHDASLERLAPRTVLDACVLE